MKLSLVALLGILAFFTCCSLSSGALIPLDSLNPLTIVEQEAKGRNVRSAVGKLGTIILLGISVILPIVSMIIMLPFKIIENIMLFPFRLVRNVILYPFKVMWNVLLLPIKIFTSIVLLPIRILQFPFILIGIIQKIIRWILTPIRPLLTFFAKSTVLMLGKPVEVLGSYYKFMK